MMKGRLLLLPLALLLQRCLASSSSQQQPNFVILLMDDLDWTLGGTTASTLHRTRKLIGAQGKTFSNWFVQTPVCCCSRAELLTGKFLHNLRLPSTTAKGGCMHVSVLPKKTHPFYQRDYFAQFFHQLNYTVGIFGKHLNTQNPTDFIPNGVDEMLLNGGGAYLDPTFTVGTRGKGAPKAVHYNNCTESTGMPCYSTAIIGNASLAWMTRHVQSNDDKPFLSLISVKAPHIQDSPGYPLSIPAPWYANTTIPEQMAPRTPNYNLSAQDHHWLVRSQRPLTKVEAQKVDDLYVSRLKTMISVDDLVQDLFQRLEQLQVLDNTYILFTSDNGFRLGQFQMPQCKLHPYENDIRVPMMIRGPGVPIGTQSSLLSTHVNIMPTLLGLATSKFDSQSIVPPTMDGTNLAYQILHDTTDNDEAEETSSTTANNNPSSLLIEYNSLGPVVRYNHLIDTYNHSFLALRILQPENTHNNNQQLHNYKYVEFRDSRKDWNCTQPPLEREFYDLDRDPFEIHNLVDEISPPFLQALQDKMKRLFHCKGGSCRAEQMTALPPSVLLRWD
ncbi:Extracellular sulfatase SULF-1 [Seminavis robusta]|uniref:Extracellular sulfatase SULF-1 n=1 Tax=Seminavis robusta TaxID=568900 RepID=A0A9N8HQB3_9STRA|nr:Extracellular sulfatase SULF-1 [Seminavis robusta]|eukprot:Sro968_g226060.1 Extracellular sulfatase SULF-1 (557) ;mRNA; f:29705-31375